MDLVDALIGKSLLAATVVEARARYRMLETLRQYGREKLDHPGETRWLMENYTSRYLRLAERGEREWFGPGQHALLETIEQEHDNVRAALHALDTPLHAELAQRLSGALWFYWIFAGRLTEGRFWLDRALASSTAPTRPRARALWANSLLAAIEGNRAAGEHLADDAYALAKQLGDTTTVTRALARQATAAVYRGDPDAAVSPSLEALARNSQTARPDDVTEMLGHMGLGMARFVQGDLVAAGHACRRADEVSRSRGDRLMRVFTLNLLARIEWRTGDLGQAAAHLAEVLRASTAPATWATSIEQLAWVACARRDHLEAALLLGCAHQVWQRYRLARVVQTAYFDVWHRDCRSRVTSALGERVFDEAFRRGSQLGVADIIEYTSRCNTGLPTSGTNDKPTVVVLRSHGGDDRFADIPCASP
jgi:hypothetical protein